MHHKRHCSAHCRYQHKQLEDDSLCSAAVHNWKGSVKSLIDLYNNDILTYAGCGDTSLKDNNLRMDKRRLYCSQQSLPVMELPNLSNRNVILSKENCAVKSLLQQNKVNQSQSGYYNCFDNDGMEYTDSHSTNVSPSSKRLLRADPTDMTACSIANSTATTNKNQQQQQHYHQLSPCKRRQLFRQNRNLTSPPLIAMSIENRNKSVNNDHKRPTFFSKSVTNLKDISKYDDQKSCCPPVKTMHENACPSAVQKLLTMFNGGDKHQSQSTTRYYQKQQPLKSSKLSVQIGSTNSYNLTPTNSLIGNTFRSTLYLDNSGRNISLSTSNSNNDTNDRNTSQYGYKAGTTAVRGKMPETNYSTTTQKVFPLENNQSYPNNNYIDRQLHNRHSSKRSYRPLLSMSYGRSRSNDWSHYKGKNQNATFYINSTESSSSTDNDSCIGNSICSESFRPALQSLNYESDDSVCGIPKPISFLYKSSESVNNEMDQLSIDGSNFNTRSLKHHNILRGQSRSSHPQSSLLTASEKCAIKHTWKIKLVKFAKILELKNSSRDHFDKMQE
ncbi:hypothetical protein GJ496_006589 [Pomphorhynchus laevis]|nr:hypothetical protein GJ496_006589 [Pomphorhynchus laevis]